MSKIFCQRCVLDDTVPGVEIIDGICNQCREFDEKEKWFHESAEREPIFKATIGKIKEDGKGKKYDCIVGVSGGQDSSYTLYMSKQLGLRPLAVHFDNGWNSEQSIKNIKKITTKLNVDLYTYVVDWEEFRDLQLSFLKASVPDVEVPSDIGIKATLYRMAVKYGVKYILYSGSNYRTEGQIPKDWTYMDGLYIKSVHKEFGTKRLKTFPNMTAWDIFYFHIVKGIKIVKLLDFIEFNSNEVLDLLKKEFEWEYYGGKHFESVYTKFIQTYYLPVKFGIDKRKVHYSALVRSGQMSREEALKKLQELPYDESKIQEEIEYVCKKLKISEKELREIMKLPPKSYRDYRTYDTFKSKFQPMIDYLKKKKLWPKIA